MSQLGKPYDPATGTGVVGTQLRLPDRRRGRDAATSRTRSSAATWARARSARRSTTSTATTSTTAASASSAAAASPSGNSGARPIQSLSVPPGTPAVRQGLEAAVQLLVRPHDERRLPGRVAGLPDPLPRPRPEYRDSFGNPLPASRSTGRPTSARWWPTRAPSCSRSCEAHPTPTSRRRARLAAGPLRRDALPVDPQHGRRDHGRRPDHLGGQQLPADVGRHERVRRRRVQLPAERGLQPDRHGRRARLPGRRGHPQVPQVGRRSSPEAMHARGSLGLPAGHEGVRPSRRKRP